MKEVSPKSLENNELNSKFNNNENLNPSFYNKNLENKDNLDNKSNNENLNPKFKEEEERAKIEKNSPYSKDINDNIRNKEELDIYKNVNLKEGEVNGKPTLERRDINYDKVDEDGKTNLNRMQEGRAPLDKDGNPIELHHIGQKSDSPLAELKKEEHRGKENNTVLHDVRKESEIDRDKFAKERSDYWKARAEQVESQRNS